MNGISDLSLRQLTAHIAGQDAAMAGATIAASAALACSLGEACVRLNFPLLGQAAAGPTAERLAALRPQLLALVDEDGAAITAFAALRAAGKTLVGQERLCRMPVEMADLAVEAAGLLQDFRPRIQVAQDDLEMAIALLDAAARAAALLLDSNLRIWPEPALLASFEPVLADLHGRVEGVRPVARIR